MNMLWFAFGFSLVFGGDVGGVIGDLRFAGFANVRNTCLSVISPTIPVLVFALFHSMFAAITPLVRVVALVVRDIACH